MNTLCGIEVTQEHADRIAATCKRAEALAVWLDEKEEYEDLRSRYDAYRPHSTFHGSFEEYLRQFLPEKKYLHKFIDKKEK